MHNIKDNSKKCVIHTIACRRSTYISRLNERLISSIEVRNRILQYIACDVSNTKRTRDFYVS